MTAFPPRLASLPLFASSGFKPGVGRWANDRRHVTLLLSVFRYTLSYATFNYYSSAAQFTYRLAFLSAAVTYGIVVYKGHIARGRLQGSVPSIVLKLASDENVQYLGE